MIASKQIEKDQASVEQGLVGKKVKKNKKSLPVQLLLVVILVVVGIVSWNNVRGVISVIDQKTAEAEETARAANLEIITITDKSCTDCSSSENFISYLKTQNVEIINEGNFDVADEEAQTIISKYKVSQVPFFIVTGEIDKHEELNTIWSAWGKVQDDTFIQTVVAPPYTDLETGKVMGRVEVTYLTNDSCSDCYDVMRNKSILESNYGVIIVKENIVDISDKEGKALIEKYNIKKVPTFFVNSEIAVYQGLLSVWSSVGSIESDGTYIFRNVEQSGVYYDLEAKETVVPDSQTQESQ